MGLAMILLGGAIGYKIFQKYTFEETIQTVKNEKDQLFNEGSQKESFKKGQTEIIVYYPLQG
ncbi:peptidoglycan GlcNAc deacetylase, partial [Streptococcus pneumoniae]